MAYITDQFTPSLFICVNKGLFPGLSADGCPARAAVVTEIPGMRQLDTALSTGLLGIRSSTPHQGDPGKETCDQTLFIPNKSVRLHSFPPTLVFS